MNLKHRWQTLCALEPERGAVEWRGEWHSWRAMQGVSQQLQQLLAANHINAAAPVGVLMRNRPAHLAAALSVLGTERCLVMINPFQGAAKLAQEIRTLRVPVLVADEEDWRHAEISAAVAHVGTLGVSLGLAAARALPELPATMEAGSASNAGEIAIQMLTSGTTGPAKRIELRRRSFERAMDNALAYESGGGEVRLKDGVALCTGPLVHIGALLLALSSMMNGRAIALMEKFNVREFVDLVVRHRPKVAPLTPTAVRMIFDAEVPKERLSSLVAVRIGTAPIDPQLRDAFEARYGIALLDAYGATEFAGGVAGWTLQDYRKLKHEKRGSVGRMQPGCEARSVCVETGEVLPPGKPGLLEFRADHIGTGAWIRTSDLGCVDADGFLFLQGRADDAINRGGFKVLPADVEAVLRKHPAVADAAVVGLADSRLGHVPVAAVELRENVSAPTADELLQFAREHLTSYQVPSRVCIVAELPRTPSMKVSQPAVRALFESSAASPSQ
ncbi:MAG: class I adenylate-forming enzyme family protein [Steroidobacteraceae bacterium]